MTGRAALLPALCVLALALACTPALPGVVRAGDGAENPQTTFFHANALYKDGDFAGAAAEYEQIVRGGLGGGNLYFNLANAYFKAGETGKAIVNYERALRLLPRDPDVRANLDFARSLPGAEPCPVPLWQRAAFPFAQSVTAGALAWWTIALYSVIFLALGVQRLLPARPRALAYVAAGAALAALPVGASAFRRVVQEHWQTSAVVTASGDTPARFEPAQGGTTHFSLGQGAVVRILERREGWVQAARCDGRRGWVPSAALEELWPR